MKGFLATTASIVAVILTIAATARSQPAGVGTWTTKSPLPAARNETIAVAVNDKIYLIGGNFPRQRNTTRRPTVGARAHRCRAA